MAPEQAETTSPMQRNSRAALHRLRRRKLLRGCGIALMILLVLGTAGWFYAKHNLGRLLSGIVQERATDSINGRIEFDSLEVDLAGRAVLEGIRIYEVDSTTPVMTCSRAVAALDFFTFIGPNRGKRAVVLTLEGLDATVVRHMDGSFNLQKLVKAPEEEADPIGLSVRVKTAQVAFTDNCLLSQGYPRLESDNEQISELLAELGYDILGPSATPGHHEDLSLHGSFNFNPQREQMSFDISLERATPGGWIQVEGSANSEFSDYNVSIAISDLDVTSLSAYSVGLFPALQLTPSLPEFTAPASTPGVSLGFNRCRIALERAKGSDLKIESTFDLSQSAVNLKLLPGLELNKLTGSLALPEQTGNLLFIAAVAGSDLSGELSLKGNRQQLGGTVVIDCPDMQGLADLAGQELPVNGSLSGTINLDGTLAEPAIRSDIEVTTTGASAKGKFSYASAGGLLGGKLNFEIQDFAKTADLIELDLPLTGSVKGTVTLGGSIEEPDIDSQLDATIPGTRIKGSVKYGGTLQALGGKLTVDTSDLAKTLQAAGVEFPVEGKFSASVSLSGTSKNPGAVASFSGGQITAAGAGLGKPSGEISLKDKVVNFEKLKFSGGEVPFSVKGRLGTDPLKGYIEATSDNIELSKLIAAATKNTKQAGSIEASGKVSFAARAEIDGEKVDASGHLWSSLATFSGQNFKDLDVKATLKTPNLEIVSATATFISAEPVALAGFTSDGPLQAALRVGGSISKLQEGDPVFALIGSAVTSNLKPDAADISFKVVGPSSKPEVRLQLKTVNEAHPLVLTASGTYEDGPSPLLASLSWYETTVNFDGVANFPRQFIDGGLKLEDVDIGRFSGSDKVRGILTAAAQITGPFSEPTISGRFNLPELTYTADRKTHTITEASAGFKLVGMDRASVSDGRLKFNGQRFDIAGSLGQDDSDITLLCADFDLFSTLALIPDQPEVQIRSSGPLEIHITGTPAKPLAAFTYSSGEGMIEGHRFTSASLKGSADLERANLEQLVITSDQGQINLAGSVAYSPVIFNASAQARGIDAGMLTPFTGIELLSSLSGQLEAGLSASGSQDQYKADGSVKLTSGKFEGVTIHEASARFSSSKDRINIDDVIISAAGTSLTGSGYIGARPGEFSLDAKAGSIDLALLKPFLPAAAPKLSGTVALDARIRPGSGDHPEIDLTVNQTGNGVNINGKQLSRISLQAALHKSVLDISRLEIGSGGSSLDVSGKINLDKQKNGNRPLDFRASATSFDLTDLQGFVPSEHQDYFPGGTITSELVLGGSQNSPELTGNLSFNLNRMPYIVTSAPFGNSITGTAGEIVFTRGGGFELRDIRFNSGEGSDLQGLAISGSGQYRVKPFELQEGGVTIELARGGAYTALYDSEMFRGTVGGTVTISANRSVVDEQGRRLPVISGSVSVTAPGQKSTYIYKPPEGGRSQQEVSPFYFDNFEVAIQPGTEFSYPSLNMQAGLYGNLVLQGRPGIKSGSQAFKVQGALDLPQGSLTIYKYVIRLDGENNRLSFPGIGSDFYPWFNGRGALVIPRVITDDSLSFSAANGMPGSTRTADKKDLKVIFTFANVKLDPEVDLMDQVRLTSEPPLSEDRILAYLSGIGGLMEGNQQISEFAASEALSLGTSFISRAIEEQFNLSAFRFGGSGSDDNPFYLDLEKEITKDMSFTYYRDFFSENYQRERFGVRYNILDGVIDNQYQNLDLKVNYEQGGFGKDSSEIMFEWTTRF